MLLQKYVEEGLGIDRIAAEFVCSPQTVKRYLKHFKAPLRSEDRGTRAVHKGMKTAYGYEYSDGEVVANLAEQRVIRTMLELQGSGLTYQQIADYLNKTVVPTRTKTKWSYWVVSDIVIRNKK